MRLHCGAQDFVGFSQTLCEALRERMTGISVQETVTAFENSPGARKPFGGQQGGLNTILCGEARMDALGPRAFGEKFHAPRRHAASDSDRCQCLFFRETEQFGGCDGRSEYAAGLRGMKA